MGTTFIYGVSRYNNTNLWLWNLHRDQCCLAGLIQKIGEDCSAGDCMDGETEQQGKREGGEDR